jgi:hypothetical protein
MMEPHMIENYIFIVFVIVVNHVGFIITRVLICLIIFRILRSCINFHNTKVNPLVSESVT